MQAKKYLGLSDAERSEIEILRGRKCSIREIAKALKQIPSEAKIRKYLRQAIFGDSMLFCPAGRASSPTRRRMTI